MCTKNTNKTTEVDTENMVPQLEIYNAGNRSKSTYVQVQRLQWKLKLAQSSLTFIHHVA